MKKIVILALALVSLNLTAQDKKEKHEDRKESRKEMIRDMSPEQMAELKTKKMTLHLDLTEAQQKEIMVLNLEHAKARKAKMETRKKRKEGDKRKEKLSTDERFKMMNDKLDDQIAEKKQMKRILNEEQYKKWDKMHSRKRRGAKKMKRKENHKNEKSDN